LIGEEKAFFAEQNWRRRREAADGHEAGSKKPEAGMVDEEMGKIEGKSQTRRGILGWFRSGWSGSGVV